MKRNLLYVDDEPDNLVVFQAAFEDDFNVLEAVCAAEALDILGKREIAVVVADQRMPEMTGIELFQVVQRDYPHTIRMLLTGYTEPDYMMDAINKGHVYSYITKPWDRDALFTLLKRGFEAYDLAVSNNALLERLDHAERCALLGRAAAEVAHEMRNQLFILPLLELVEEKYQDDAELLELTRVARETHDCLNELINEVTDFVRKDHEGCKKIPIKLSDLAREAISLAGMDKDVPKQWLKLEIRAEPTICCHKAKIQQVVFNLVRNATDAVKRQEVPAITITVDREGSDGMLSVRDNGSGIDPSHLERIWEPFFTTKGADGTGLGLDVCRRVVEDHDGRITCQSRPGEGAVFEIRFPAAADPGDASS